MQLPLTLTFRNLPHSAAIEAAVRRHIDKLEHFGQITGCTVVVEKPHRHRHTGKPYVIHVRLLVPGAVLAVSRDTVQPNYEDPYVALHHAFDAARRRLEDHVRLRRGDVKTHRPRRAGAARRSAAKA